MSGGAVLLAAGISRRFGSDKRTHQLSNGQPLLHATVEKYLDHLEQIVVVLRPDDDAVKQGLQTRFGTRAPDVVSAADAHLGMGHSLAAGIKAISGWEYAFVGLADMPFIDAATLDQLVAVMLAHGSNAIVQPSYQGTPGHPVGFGRDHFAALQALTGDAGARSVVQALQERVVQLPVADPGVLRDVDRPADLEA